MESYDSFNLNDKIDTFSTKTLSLNDEVSSLNNQVNLLDTGIVNLSLEFILIDYSKRQQSANNILLPNLSEPKTASDPSDAAIIIELLSILNLNIVPVRLSRLGKSSVKSRPIKVELPSFHIVFKL